MLNEDAFQNQFIAQLLHAEAPSFARAAAELLASQHPALAARYAPQPVLRWSAGFEGRIHDLAAAIEARRPELFSAQVAWAKVSFLARSVPLDDLRVSLTTLEKALLPNVPEDDRALVRGYLQRALSDLHTAPSEPPAVLTANLPHGVIASRFLVAVLEGSRRRACDAIVNAAASGVSVKDMYRHVFTPVLSEVGRLWHMGEITVADEHFASATTMLAMSLLYPSMPREPENGRTFAAVAVEGNTHEIGVRMVADWFEMAGWRAIHLGASLPAEDVVAAVRDFKVDVVGLSATLHTQLREMTDVISAIRATEPLRHVRIIVGGSALAQCPGLWKELGADGYAPDAERAVQVAASLPPFTAA